MSDKRSDIFISYSVQDKDTAEKVCSDLEARGLSCWIAPRDISPGESWSGAIIGAIENSRCLVFIFSSNSNESPHVARELESAVGKRIPIIPFKIQNIKPSKSVEYFVTSAQWLDSSKNPSDADLDKLFRAASRLLGMDASSEERGSVVQSARGKSRNAMPMIITGILAVLAIAGITFFAMTKKEPEPNDAQKIEKPDDGDSGISQPIPDEKVDNREEPGDATEDPEPVVLPKTGKLTIRTVPSGARVVVGGKNRGVSPLTVKDVEEGSYDVEITLKGYEPVKVSVDVAENGDVDREYAMKPLKASLLINTEPNGASIILDGKSIGKVTPCRIDVDPGRDFSITVMADGYSDVTRSFHLGPGENGTVTIPLEKEQGVLVVSGSPLDAELWIDGEKRGAVSSSGARFNVSTGNHSIEVRKKAYGEMIPREILINPGKETTFNYSLELLGGTVRVSPLLKGGDGETIDLEVVLDDESLGIKTLPCDIPNVKPGKHSIQIKGGKLSRPMEKAFRLSDSEDARVVVVFDLR